MTKAKTGNTGQYAKKNRKNAHTQKKSPPIGKTFKKNQPHSFDKYLQQIVYLLVGILIFYPPYLKGLYFNEDVFFTHIFTGVVFLLVWAKKLRDQDTSFLKTPLDYAVLAFVMAYLFSLIGAVQIGIAYYEFLRVLNYFVIYWCISQLVKNYEDYKIILRILTAAAVGVAAIGILAAAGHSQLTGAYQNGVIFSTLQYHNATGTYLSAMSLIALSLWIQEKQPVMKFIYSLCTYLMFIVVLGTMSKGAWLVLLLGGALMFLGLSRPNKIKLASYSVLTFLPALLIIPRLVNHAEGTNTIDPLWFVLAGSGIVWLGQILGKLMARRIRTISLNKFVIAAGVLFLLLGAGYYVSQHPQMIPQSITSELGGLANLQDNSYTTRLDTNAWGLAIIKDHPINGTGAGGWNALYHRYQDYQIFTAEVHNHFIQVGVEAGIIGIAAFLSIWFLFLLSLYRIYRSKKPETEDKWVLVWGTASAAMVLGVHAAIDFDLSLAAMAILLWILFGLINAGFKINQISTIKTWQAHPAINLTIAGVMAALMLISGSSLWLAHHNNDEAREIIQKFSAIEDSHVKQKFTLPALSLFEKATREDPWNGSYFADLAYANAEQFRILYEQNNPAARDYYQKALTAMETAEKLSPEDLQVRKSLLEASILLGNSPGKIRQTEAALRINPWAIHAYENYAQTNLSYAQYLFEKQDLKTACNILENVTALEERYRLQKNRLNPSRLSLWQGDAFALTPVTESAIASARQLQEKQK